MLSVFLACQVLMPLWNQAKGRERTEISLLAKEKEEEEVVEEGK